MQWSPLILLTMKYFMKYKSQLAMYVHSIILYVAMHKYSYISVYLTNIIFMNLSDA